MQHFNRQHQFCVVKQYPEFDATSYYDRVYSRKPKAKRHKNVTNCKTIVWCDVDTCLKGSYNAGSVDRYSYPTCVYVGFKEVL